MKLPPRDHMHGGVLQPLLNPVTHSYKLVLFRYTLEYRGERVHGARVCSPL